MDDAAWKIVMDPLKSKLESLDCDSSVACRMTIIWNNETIAKTAIKLDT